MRHRFISLAIAATLSCFATATAVGQAEVMTQTAGRAYYSTNLRCPPNTLMIGAVGQFSYPISIDCSAFSADGRRTGAVATLAFPKSQDPLSQMVSAPRDAMNPTKTVSCPGDQAVMSFRTHGDTWLDYIEVVCAGIGANGGRTASATAGVIIGSSSVAPSVLACPGSKFAKGFVMG